MLKNVKIIGFLDILNKMKENLGKEHVNKGLLSFQEKQLEQFPCYPLKNDSFPVLPPLFYLSLPKIRLSYLHKKFIFEISNSLEKS